MWVTGEQVIEGDSRNAPFEMFFALFAILCALSLSFAACYVLSVVYICCSAGFHFRSLQFHPVAGLQIIQAQQSNAIFLEPQPLKYPKTCSSAFPANACQSTMTARGPQRPFPPPEARRARDFPEHMILHQRELVTRPCRYMRQKS